MDSLDTHASSSSSSSFHVPVCRLLRSIIRGALTFIFGIVGVLLGAVTGALIGLATESGVFRGSGVGAISGAVFSMEVVESSLVLWTSRESKARSIFYVVGILRSLCSGRLVREKIDPAMQNAVRSQMIALDIPVMDDIDIFGTGGTEGMTRASVDRLPVISISMKNNVDASGESFSCTVCLQEFELGETARILPHCQHKFHLPCIDSWLMRHEYDLVLFASWRAYAPVVAQILLLWILSNLLSSFRSY